MVFIRYFESDVGFHIRFRIQVDNSHKAQEIARVKAILEQAEKALPDLPESQHDFLVNAGRPYQFDAKATQVIEALYEPEWEKFGGPQGLDIAHRWFQPSSELTLQILQAEQAGTADRDELVNHLTRAVCEAFEVKPHVAKFLEQYAMSWLPRSLIHSNNWRQQFFAEAIQKLDHNEPLLTPFEYLSEPAQHMVRTWSEVASRTAQSLRKANYSHGFIQSQAWQLIHLMNNRLGFSPLDEAYLATMLEAWYREEARHAA